MSELDYGGKLNTFRYFKFFFFFFLIPTFNLDDRGVDRLITESNINLDDWGVEISNS